EEAKRLLAHQLARPVRFVDVVERLYREGARTFVEVGPRSTLTGLVRSILEGERFAAVAMDASAGKKPGLWDLASTLAELAALGHPVRLSEWERTPAPVRGAAPKRKKRMAIPICGANYRAPREELPPRRSPPPSVSMETPMSHSPSNPEASLVLVEALRANGETLRASQQLQAQTALAHQLLLGQQRLLEQAAGMPETLTMPVPAVVPPAPPAPPSQPAFVPPPAPVAPAVPAPAPLAPAPAPVAPAPRPIAPAPALAAPAP